MKLQSLFPRILVLLPLFLLPVLRAGSAVRIERTDLPGLPVALRQPVMGEIDGRPVVLGGWTDGNRWSEAVFVLEDPAAGWIAWPGPGGLARAEAAVAAVGAKVCVAGGHDRAGWSAEVVVLGWDPDGLSRRDLPDLDVALQRPAATPGGAGVIVGGFVSDRTGSVLVRLFALDLESDNPAWESLPELGVPGMGRMVLAWQTDGAGDGLYLAFSPDDGTDLHLYRYSRADGWTARAGPGPGVDVLLAQALGQSHIAFFASGPEAPGATGVRAKRLMTYSTITNTWVNLEAWDDGPEEVRLAALPDGLLIAGPAVAGEGTAMARARFVVGKGHFAWLDYLAVGAYLAGMILIGVYFSRRETGTVDFFVGGRRMPWWAVGFSLYATGTSAISFMAVPAKSFATDWLYLANNVIGLVAVVPVALLIVPLIRRLSLTSTYEYLEMRFHPSVRLVGSIQCVVYQLAGRMSVVLFLPALALSAVTGMGVVTSILIMGLIATLYTVLGGIKAVIWTDVVQVVVLLGGALLCLIIVVARIDGGLGSLLAVAATDQKTHMFEWRLDLTVPTVWIFLILAVVDVGTWPRDQVMVQRVLSTRSARAAGRSVWVMAAIVIPGSLLFFAMGTALYGFYKLNPERLSPMLNTDATFPYFIAAELPPGVAGLIIAALFAASMSTLDSSMNSVSTVVVTDFYKRFKKSVSDHRALVLARWITVLTGAFGTGFALYLSRMPDLGSVWDTFIMLAGLLGGGFGGVYALGMFTRRANWQGALIGTVCSVIITLWVKAHTPIHVLLYGGVAVISCVVIGYGSSFFFPSQEDRLKGLTVYLRDKRR